MRPLPCVSMWASHTLLLSSSLTYTRGTGFERESRAVVLPVGTKLTWNHFRHIHSADHSRPALEGKHGCHIGRQGVLTASHFSHGDSQPRGGAEDLYIDHSLGVGQEYKLLFLTSSLLTHRSYSCEIPRKGRNYPAGSFLYPMKACA